MLLPGLAVRCEAVDLIHPVMARKEALRWRRL